MPSCKSALPKYSVIFPSTASLEVLVVLSRSTSLRRLPLSDRFLYQRFDRVAYLVWEYVMLLDLLTSHFAARRIDCTVSLPFCSTSGCHRKSLPDWQSESWDIQVKELA